MSDGTSIDTRSNMVALTRTTKTMASTRKKASSAKTSAPTTTPRAISTRATAARATSPRAAAGARKTARPPATPGPAATGRGRPARRVFINVSVRESTRKAMNTLRLRHGITQGELLDQLFTGKLRVQ